MKKLLFILIITLLFISCESPTYENTVDNLTVEKSEEILSSTFDTIIIVRDELTIYEINNNKVISKYNLVNKNTLKNNLMTGHLLLVLLIIILLGMFIGAILNQ